MAAASIAATAVGACTIEPPLERANPFDPHSIYSMRLVGPDSIHSLGEEFTVSLISDPVLADDRFLVEWVAFRWLEPVGVAEPVPRVVLSPRSPGQFAVVLPSARYREVSVGAYFNAVAVGHRIWVGQKAATMALTCSTDAIGPCTDPLDVGAIVRVTPLMRDPLGNDVLHPKWAIIRARVTSRDPSVVAYAPLPMDSLPYVRLEGVGSGSTWVVVDIDGTLDSIALTFASPNLRSRD